MANFVRDKLHNKSVNARADAATEAATLAATASVHSFLSCGRMLIRDDRALRRDVLCLWYLSRSRRRKGAASRPPNNNTQRHQDARMRLGTSTARPKAVEITAEW